MLRKVLVAALLAAPVAGYEFLAVDWDDTHRTNLIKAFRAKIGEQAEVAIAAAPDNKAKCDEKAKTIVYKSADDKVVRTVTFEAMPEPEAAAKFKADTAVKGTVTSGADAFAEAQAAQGPSCCDRMMCSCSGKEAVAGKGQKFSATVTADGALKEAAKAEENKVKESSSSI